MNNIIGKASRSLGFLHRNLNNRSKAIKEHAFKILVRPQIEYATTVRYPYQQSHIDKIEKVQRRAARYVTRRQRNRSSVSNMINEIGWKAFIQDEKKLDSSCVSNEQMTLLQSAIKD